MSSYGELLANTEKAGWRKRYGPHLVAVPLTTIIFSLASLALQLGAPGIVGGAFIGFGWSLSLGFVAGRLSRRESWKPHLADAPVFVAVIASGLLIGGGLMYGLLMNAALGEPSTTYTTLSALMRPAVPYFIAVNTLMEALVIPLVVFLNWHIPKRRTLILVAVMVYFAMRVWTYLTYAPSRLDITTHPLSAAEAEWFKETLKTDYRGVLNVVTHAAFILAAFVPSRGGGAGRSRVKCEACERRAAEGGRRPGR